MVLLPVFEVPNIASSNPTSNTTINPTTNIILMSQPRSGNDVIRIDNNFDLAANAVRGKGTKSSPYIIENHTIDAGGRGCCIYIGNTTSYFVLRNCTLTGAEGDYNPTYYGTGLTLNNVKNGRIESNNISHNKNGIYVYHSSNITIVNNNCSNHTNDINSFGIEIYFSKYNNVKNNIAINNSHGILTLAQSNYNNIVNNTCTSNVNSGIYMPGINNNAINNTCIGNIWGLNVGGSYLKIMNNTCHSNREGIRFSGYYSEISNNNCTNNNSTGIWVYSSDNNDCKENLCINNKYGIYLSISDYNRISKNVVINNRDNGFMSRWSNYYIIEDNIFIGNSNSGLELNESTYGIIRRNNCSNNRDGILIIDNSNSNTFYQNFISSNTNSGIYITPANPPCRFFYNIINSNPTQAFQKNINYWDNGEGEGNYWSDYTGLDNGADGRIAGDGIGDTEIPHPAVFYDNYPFMNSSGWLFMDPPNLQDPGTVDTDGNFTIKWLKSTKAHKYILEEDTSNSFTSPQVIYNNTDLKLKITGKLNGTYYYRIKGYNNFTISPWSNIVDMTVDLPPNKPRGVKIEDVSGHKLNLTWYANEEPDLAGYHIFINDSDSSSEGPFHYVKSVSNTTIKTTITGLIEETAYHFVLAAFDKMLSNSTYSNVASTITLDETAPSAPTGVNATFLLKSYIYLKWNPNSEPDVEGYQIYMNDTGVGSDGPYHIINTSFGKDTEYYLEDFIEKTTYYFKIRAFDEVPNISPFSDFDDITILDMTPPSAPTGLAVIDKTYTSLTLSWNQNPEDDVVGYILYRYNSTIDPNKFILPSPGLITNTSFVDNNLEEHTTYYYKLKAVDAADLHSPFTNFVPGTTLQIPRPPVINNTISDFGMFEDTYDDISINLLFLFKDPNNDKMTFRVSGQEHLNVTIYQSNGTVVLIPEKDWNGIEALTFYANDSKFEISEEINVTVKYVNDPPGAAEIITPKDGSNIKEGNSLNFTGYCTDPDLPYGDVLIYKWFSSIDGKLGNGANLTEVQLSIGTHKITLEVKDKLNKNSTANITVTVTKNTGSKDDETNDFALDSMTVIVVIIIIVIVLTSILFIILRKKKSEGEKIGEFDEEAETAEQSTVAEDYLDYLPKIEE